MRLRITDAADQDIKSIDHYGRRHYGDRQTIAYIARLFDDLEWIRDWPLTSRERNEVRPPVRVHPSSAHNILYAVQTDEVLILRVLHHSVNWIDLL